MRTQLSGSNVKFGSGNSESENELALDSEKSAACEEGAGPGEGEVNRLNPNQKIVVFCEISTKIHLNKTMQKHSNYNYSLALPVSLLDDSSVREYPARQ